MQGGVVVMLRCFGFIAPVWSYFSATDLRLILVVIIFCMSLQFWGSLLPAADC